MTIKHGEGRMLSSEFCHFNIKYAFSFVEERGRISKDLDIYLLLQCDVAAANKPILLKHAGKQNGGGLSGVAESS